MSTNPTQTTNLCSPSSVATMLPNAINGYEWCAVPATQPNTTSTVMQHCCGSDEQVYLIGGCEWCYYSDSAAGDDVDLNEDFANCLHRGARQENVQVVQAAYCNVPEVTGAASGNGMRGWGMWSAMVLVGCSVFF